MTAPSAAATDSEPKGHTSPHRRFFALLQPERADVVVILLFSIVNGILLLATPLAVDAVVNNIAFGGGATGEVHAGDVAHLLEADGVMPAVDYTGGQGCGEEADEVGAVHPKGGVPAG